MFSTFGVSSHRLPPALAHLLGGHAPTLGCQESALRDQPSREAQSGASGRSACRLCRPSSAVQSSESEPRLPCAPKDWGRDEFLFVHQNALLDLRSQERN